MILKITMIKDDSGNNDREHAFATDKTGKFQRVVTLDDETRKHLEKNGGKMYVNAVNEKDQLSIRGMVVAKF